GGAAGAALGLLPGDRVGLVGPRAADVVLSFRWDSTGTANGFTGYVDSAEGGPGLGTHGSGSPHEPRCVRIGSGPSFRQHVVSGLPSGNVDIAPTVLRLLGVTSDAVFDGRPLLEGLRATTERPPEASAPHRYEATCRVDGVSLVHGAVVEVVGPA